MLSFLSVAMVASIAIVVLENLQRIKTMNNQFDEFLEEVQNDIRHEKYQKLWKQYGKTVTTAISGVFVAIALFMLWDNYQDRKRAELSDKFFSALGYIAEGKNNEATAMLDTMSVSDTKAYGYLRDIQKAQLLLKNSDAKVKEQGLALYEAMGKNTSLPGFVRDMAHLLAAKEYAAQKSKSVDEIVRMLEGVRGDKNPLRHFAREFIAEQLYIKGDAQAALQTFAELARDNESPDGIKLRAQLMVQVVNQSVPTGQGMNELDDKSSPKKR